MTNNGGKEEESANIKYQRERECRTGQKIKNNHMVSSHT